MTLMDFVNKKRDEWKATTDCTMSFDEWLCDELYRTSKALEFCKRLRTEDLRLKDEYLAALKAHDMPIPD